MATARPEAVTAEAHKQRGDELLNQGNYSGASLEYEKATELKPDYAAAYVSWSTSLIQHGQYEEAIAKARQALEQHPTTVLAAQSYNNWGVALDRLGDQELAEKRLQEAAEKYQKATEVDPTSSLAFANLARSFRRLQRYAEAITAYQKATALAPDAMGKAELAGIYSEWGEDLCEHENYPDAAKQYLKAVENGASSEACARLLYVLDHLGPVPKQQVSDGVAKILQNDADACVRWGSALVGRKLYKPAIEKYQQAVDLKKDLKPEDASIYVSWGNALLNLGRYEEAIEKYQEAIALKPNKADEAWAHTNWGLALRGMGQYGAAIERYRKATELSPKYQAAYKKWGDALCEYENYSDAAKQYLKAIENGAGSDACARLLYVLNHLGPVSKQETADGVAKILQNDADASVRWGSALAGRKQYEPAIELYRQAIDVKKNLKPEDANTYLLWGNALLSLERYEQAIEKYQKALALKASKADRAWAYNNWGAVFTAQKKYDKAIEKYKEAIEQDGLFARPYNNWADALYKQRDYSGAADRYMKAIDIDPLEGRYDRFVVCLERLSADEKQTYTSKLLGVIDGKPEFFDAWINWGGAFHRRGSYADAVEKYRKAAELTPELTPSTFGAYQSWGDALASLYRYDEAFELTRKAIQADPDNPYGYHNLAVYHWRQGRYKDGRKQWAEALRRYPRRKHSVVEQNDPTVFYFYAAVLAEIRADLPAALEVLMDGLRLDPENADILTGLGDVYQDLRDGGYSQQKGKVLTELAGLYSEAKGAYSELKNKALSTLSLGPNPERTSLPECTAAYWMSRENYRKAKNLLKLRATPEQDDDPAAFRTLGELLLKMEEDTEPGKTRFEEAEKCFLRALDLEDDGASSSTYTDLGSLYAKREDFAKAARCFAEALRRDAGSLDIRKNLAEAYLKSGEKLRAEEEYQKVLMITDDHVEAQIGLGEVYKAMGDDSSDADLYEQAIAHFDRGISLSQAGTGSKILKKKELAAAYYSRGYATVKRYEASAGLPEPSLLAKARRDFSACAELDPDHHKAKRAVEKLRKRLSSSAPHWLDRFAPGLILVPAIVMLVLGHLVFFIHKPAKVYENVHMSWSNYITLTGVSLFFVIVGLSLTRLLKIKLGTGGIELEKSSVEQIGTSGPLGIAK